MKEDLEVQSVQRRDVDLEAQRKERINVALLKLIESVTIDQLLSLVKEDEYSNPLCRMSNSTNIVSPLS